MAEASADSTAAADTAGNGWHRLKRGCPTLRGFRSVGATGDGLRRASGIPRLAVRDIAFPFAKSAQDGALLIRVVSAKTRKI